MTLIFCYWLCFRIRRNVGKWSSHHPPHNYIGHYVLWKYFIYLTPVQTDFRDNPSSKNACLSVNVIAPSAITKLECLKTKYRLLACVMCGGSCAFSPGCPKPQKTELLSFNSNKKPERFPWSIKFWKAAAGVVSEKWSCPSALASFPPLSFSVLAVKWSSPFKSPLLASLPFLHPQVMMQFLFGSAPLPFTLSLALSSIGRA